MSTPNPSNLGVQLEQTAISALVQSGLAQVLIQELFTGLTSLFTGIIHAHSQAQAQSFTLLNTQPTPTPTSTPPTP